MYILIDGDVTAYTHLTDKLRNDAIKYGWHIVYVPVELTTDTWPRGMYGEDTDGNPDWDLADPGTEEDEKIMPPR